MIGRKLEPAHQAVAAENFGVLGMIFAIDQPASSALTRERIGWKPTHPSLIDDLQTESFPD